MMNHSRPFQSDLVLEERVSESTLRGYNVGFDQNRFRLQPLVDLICDAITEFAFGPHIGESVPLSQTRRRQKEAAERVYTTDNYKHRGEFGELILHLLLRDWCGTLPLISKIYFKDTNNVPVHGFDGVHITTEGDKKLLWLGESKLYKDGREGVLDLAQDLKVHLENDYLRKEFNLISPKLPETTPEIDYWRKLMHANQKMETILDGICIPMVCTYSSKLFANHSDNTSEYVTDFVNECTQLAKYFKNKNVRTDVDVILMLLPVPSKEELTKEVDARLKHMQAI